MTAHAGSSARELAAHVVAQVLDGEGLVAPTLSDALERSALDARDRGLCTELAYGTLRWALALDRSLLRTLDKPRRGLDKKIRPHLLVAAYQLQHMPQIPRHAAVNAAVDAVKRVRRGMSGLANAVLRNLGSPLHEQLDDHASLAQLAEAFGLPARLVEQVCARVPPAERRAALLAMNARPPLSLWCRDQAAQEALLSAQSGLTPHPFVDGVLLGDGLGQVRALPGYDAGAFMVMDPGSAAVAQLCGDVRGQRVLDLCAAPGSKAIALAIGGAKVTAVERDPRRAERMIQNAARMGVTLDVVVEDARAFTGAESFDVVLVDAPCSGLGTTRRRPEVRWRPPPPQGFAPLQREILSAACTQVRPGGALVYAVCSPMDDEGAAVVEHVLGCHPLRREPAAAVLKRFPPSAFDGRGQLRFFTYQHAGDGFFAARLRA